MYRIAAATTDGKVVNEHFGRAEQFLIIETEEDGSIHMKELRTLPLVCQGNNHDAQAMKERVQKLADCNYVVVSQIGVNAEYILGQHGIGVFVVHDLIEEAVQKIVKYLKRQWKNETR